MARQVSSGAEFGVLLKGSNVVNANKRAVAGIVLAVRDAPKGFGSPYIIDFDADVLPGIHSWPCNVTQSRRLADMIGPNPDKWEGYAVGLGVCQVNNPKLDELVDSLEVTFVVEPKEAAKKRATKQMYHKATDPKVPAGNGKKTFTKDDVPF